jgi:bis(5'-nucleosyl)-tetraphosphatase (symmetrical)
MSTYIIGDVHGHLKELERLLLKINFNSQDILWLTGDLINGGSQSLETIRFIKSMGKQAVCVLGNHDLILMACAYNKLLLNKIIAHNQHNLQAINGVLQVLSAPDVIELINWLEYRSLAHFDKKFNLLLVHAGVHPSWDINKTLILAKEVELILQSSNKLELYNNIYGDQPDNWNDSLFSWDRIRCIINYLTRVRFCTKEGKLDLQTKGNKSDLPSDYVPWYAVEKRQTKDTTLAFGHWSALLGNANYPNVISLDTGCRWGGKLTAYKVESAQLFDVKSDL